MILYIYTFKDGTKLKLLNNLSKSELKKLMSEHGGSVVINFEEMEEAR